MRSPSLPPLALLALALLTPALLPAQEHPALRSVVLGYVVDQATGTPLPGVVVELPEEDRRAITDAEGRFVFMGVEPGQYRARVRHLGYQEHSDTWTVPTGAMRLTIALGPAPVTLEGITVHGYSFGAQLRDRRLKATVASQAIERDRLAITGARSGLEAVMEGALLNRTPCGIGGRQICIWSRGRAIAPQVYIDDRQTYLEELDTYPPRELYAIEVYGGGRQIRAYTLWWVESEGRRPQRALRPIR